MLGILSILSVAQSLLLSAVFFKKRDANAFNKHLASLFLILAVAMFLISINKFIVLNAEHLLELIEFALTFSAGPILYVMATSILGNRIQRARLLVHFIPAILFLMISLVGLLDIITLQNRVDMPAMVPVVHMQLYTVWLCWILVKGYREEDFEITTGFKWLVTISILLVSIHIAQWIRFFYADVEWLELIVPVTAFLGVYSLVVYGFLKSGLFFKANNEKTTFFSEGEEKKQAEILIRIMEKENVYQNPELTLDEFSKMSGLPSYKVSHLINKTMKTGFNEWINSYRVEKVKILLNDPLKNYLTFEAIGQEAGFNSRSVFYHAFKKETGMTPAQFRKEIELLRKESSLLD